MISAPSAQNAFFEELKNQLEEQNMPFTFSRRNQWAIINKNNPSFNNPCLSVEFLLRYEHVRISIFLLDDVSLYNKLVELKAQIEEKLGFECIWKNGDKNPNSRRIFITIPFNKFNIDYQECAKRSIEKTKLFINVFSRYIDC